MENLNIETNTMNFLTKTDLSLGSQMGSQMSQYASLLSISQETKHKIVLFKNLLNVGRGIKIVDPFNLTCEIKSLDEINSSNEKIKLNKIYVNENVLLDQNIFNLSIDQNWDIGNLFHTFAYWDKYKDIIIKEFKFKPEIYEKAKNYLNNISGLKVSIHFRRTDYLQVSSLNLTRKYYEEAISTLSSKVQNFKLIVFSDDMEWCKNNIKGKNVLYCENFLNYEDMCIMSLCDHNIIANSTFSWWGAYLNQNPNKIVICPHQYLNVTDLNFINGNYFPKDWISI